MGYLRKKAGKNKNRTVSGYTRSDGTRVASYLRAKNKATRRKRYVNRG